MEPTNGSNSMKKDVGIEWRKRHKHLYHQSIGDKFTPIVEIASEFTVGTKR